MFRKLFGILLVMFFLAGTAFAADSPRTAGDNELNYVVGVGDTSSGDCWEIDTNGAGLVKRARTTITVVESDDSAVGEACYVHSIHVSGSEAGEYVDVYDRK